MENKLWLPKGKGQGEEKIRSLGLTDLHYYSIKNKGLL